MNSNMLSLMAVLLAGGISGLACDCLPIAPKQAIHTSAVVFHGAAIEVEHLHMLDAVEPATGQRRRWIPALDDAIVVTFKVDGYWKGPVTPLIKVFSTVRPSMCDGFEFSIGKEYLVYASYAANPPGPNEIDVAKRFKGDAVYDVGLCPGPVLPGTLQTAIAVLGKPAR